MSSGGASRRRLRAVTAHVAAPRTSSAEVSASGTVAKVVIGAGGAALAGHVGYEWRKHGLAESWRKSLQRKGSAFALTEGARWLGIHSGLLHFSAVVRQKRMAASDDVDDAELASAVGDMHSWFYEKTGELNDPKKKEKQTRDAYAKAHPAAENESGSSDADSLPTFSKAEVADHAAKDDCWVIIRGKVYDLSPWLASHPGGPAILLKHAGGDATEMFTVVRASQCPFWSCEWQAMLDEFTSMPLAGYLPLAPRYFSAFACYLAIRMQLERCMMYHYTEVRFYCRATGRALSERAPLAA